MAKTSPVSEEKPSVESGEKAGEDKASDDKKKPDKGSPAKQSSWSDKLGIMGGMAVTADYTRKYGFDVSASAKVTAKLAAVPAPTGFLQAIQADYIGRTKRATALKPPEPVARVTFVQIMRDGADGVHANKKYELTVVGDQTYEGYTSPQGLISHQITADSREGTLKIWLEPDKPTTINLVLGPLPDILTPEGVRQRLSNLGFTATKLTDAVTEFQQSIGAPDPPNGEFDDPATQLELQRLHGGR